MNEKELKTSHLLFDQAPLLVRPELACRIGLNEAIVLQQIHYWLENKKNSVKEKDLQDERTYINGKFWTYDSYPEWQKQFPFWSVRTVERIFTSLENKGVLISGVFNKLKADRTKWYTIDYDTLDTYEKSKKVDKKKNDKNIGIEQSANLSECGVEQSANLSSPICQLVVTNLPTCGEHDDNLWSPIPKTSSKTSSKITSKISSSSETVEKEEIEVIQSKDQKKDEEDDLHISELLSTYNENISKSNKLIEKKLAEWTNILPFEVIKLEIETCAMYGAKTWTYVSKALSEDKEFGIDTVEKLENKYQQFKKKSSLYDKNLIRTEMVPSWLHEEEADDSSKNNKDSIDPKAKKAELLAQLHALNNQPVKKDA